MAMTANFNFRHSGMRLLVQARMTTVVLNGATLLMPPSQAQPHDG
jgi:hypothetical protein